MTMQEAAQGAVMFGVVVSSVRKKKLVCAPGPRGDPSYYQDALLIDPALPYIVANSVNSRHKQHIILDVLIVHIPIATTKVLR